MRGRWFAERGACLQLVDKTDRTKGRSLWAHIPKWKFFSGEGCCKGTVNCDGSLWKDKPLAHVKLPALKFVFNPKSFTLPMVQGLQWFLRICFSPLLSQQEEQSSSVLQMHTSLDTWESFNNPQRIYFMFQSVLALFWFTSLSWAREQIAEAGIWDGGKESRMLPRAGAQGHRGAQGAHGKQGQQGQQGKQGKQGKWAQRSLLCSPGALSLPECCWKEWGGTDSLLGGILHSHREGKHH